MIYKDYIKLYFEEIQQGNIKASKELKLLIDFLKVKLKDAVIDHKKINESIKKVEKYFPFKLFLFEKFILSFIVGVYDKNNKLMFDEFFIMCGRGSGKNGFISCISFLLLTDKIDNYNIDIVATSEDQAKTSFYDIYDLLERRELKNKFSRTKKQITYKGNKSSLRYRTSNAKTKDGARLGAVIFDEVHAYENYDNIKVFTSSLGKVLNPRTFYITTDGYLRGSVIDDLKELSLRVLNQEFKNTHMFPFICKIDTVEEMDNIENWEKACPSINSLPNLKDEMLKEYEKAKSRESLKIEFLTKRMNIPCENPYIEVADWNTIKLTNRPVPDLKGAFCIGAIDYADMRDFCAVGLLFKKGDTRYFIHHSFICSKSLRLTKFNFDIKKACETGLCTIVNCDILDSQVIIDYFLEAQKKYVVKKVCCDIFRASILKEKFMKIGIELSMVRNGVITHNKLAPLVDDLFNNKLLVLGDDFMMRWYINNTYVEIDQKGNKAYKKIEPIKRKTDGFFALLHALTLDHELNENTIKFYDVYNF